MPQNKNIPFDAVVFDLDGVITKTAVTHFAAWKKTFDAFLRKREKEPGEPFVPFTRKDYLDYVDGKPRYKGVDSFLKARGIALPWGKPGDAPGKETVCGVGNKKNNDFMEVLEKEGTEVYPSTLKLIHNLKKQGIKLGVASSSKNCLAVLKAVKLEDMFEARVDGVVSAEMGLQGKPEPDIFTTACQLMRVKPARSIVIEDAVSGVQAGSKGKFGLTLGIARDGNMETLRKNGADAVVEDLAEVNGVEGMGELFAQNNPQEIS